MQSSKFLDFVLYLHETALANSVCSLNWNSDTHPKLYGNVWSHFRTFVDPY